MLDCDELKWTGIPGATVGGGSGSVASATGGAVAGGAGGSGGGGGRGGSGVASCFAGASRACARAGNAMLRSAHESAHRNSPLAKHAEDRLKLNFVSSKGGFRMLSSWGPKRRRAPVVGRVAKYFRRSATDRPTGRRRHHPKRARYKDIKYKVRSATSLALPAHQGWGAAGMPMGMAAPSSQRPYSCRIF